MHRLSGHGARVPGLRRALDELGKGAITASELTKHALDRAEASKRTLNAFSAVASERAMAAAAESDRRYAAGTQRPLEGLPIGVKDLIGNVFEWTSSKPSLYPGSKGTLKDLTEPYLMIRGGSFFQKPTGSQAITASYRVEIPASKRSAELGFRLVRSS